MDFQLNLPQNDVQLVLNALAELPLKVSMPVYTRIQSQVVAQTNSDKTIQSAPD